MIRTFSEQEFNDKTKSDVWICVILAISLGISLGLDYVNPFEVECKEKTIIFSIPREEWKGFLDNALNFFISIEDYEICSDIKFIQNELL